MGAPVMWEISWSRLAEEERDLLRAAEVVNGCGGKGSWIDPPDWLFVASCDQHDFHYWRGGDEGDRAEADWQFYQAMIVDTKSASWWRRPFARIRAWSYYKAVRLFGAKYWNDGPVRGRVDLDAALRQGRAKLAG